MFSEIEKRRLFERLDTIIELFEKLFDVENKILERLESQSKPDVSNCEKESNDSQIELELNVVDSVEQTDEPTKKKSRLAEDKEEYKRYKAEGGEMKWNEWHTKKRSGFLSH